MTESKTDDLSEVFRRERQELRRLESQITASRGKVKELRALRDRKWRELDKAGVPRAVCAKWSGVDPMVVTRALKNG